MNDHNPVERFPLSWPVGWKRTPRHQRTRSPFARGGASTIDPATNQRVTMSKQPLSVADALKRLSRELRLLGATAEILSTNVEIRLDGLPYTNRKEPEDPGAAVYFKLNKQDRCLACDRWNRVADNIAALAQHIDALRRIERYGVGTIEQAFRGYTALPEAASDWWVILGLSPNATLEQVDAKFRELAFVSHPDRGGTHEQMARLSEARQSARKALSR